MTSLTLYITTLSPTFNVENFEIPNEMNFYKWYTKVGHRSETIQLFVGWLVFFLSIIHLFGLNGQRHLERAENLTKSNVKSIT